jgi:hypothetical protein
MSFRSPNEFIILSIHSSLTSCFISHLSFGCSIHFPLQNHSPLPFDLCFRLERCAPFAVLQLGCLSDTYSKSLHWVIMWVKKTLPHQNSLKAAKKLNVI